MRNFGRAAAAIVALSIAGFAPAVAQGTMASTAAAVKAIDTDCSAIEDATMALHPTHLVLVQSHWKVVSDADAAALERTPKSITFVDVLKQGSNYAWVHSHTFDNKGDQRATQLCFRQKDGTLQRACQATTVSELSSAVAKQAYYASSGSLIQKTTAFVVDDPSVVKTVKALPFYHDLP